MPQARIGTPSEALALGPETFKYNKTYVMLCYVMLCYVMLCYVMLCYVTLRYVTLRYVMLCYVMLCYVMFNCFIVFIVLPR